MGHSNPTILEAVRNQQSTLVHGLGDLNAHPLRVELAERLGSLSPIPDPIVYFAVSGSDAVEIAIKTALLNSKGSGLVAFEEAYHGSTLGALAATGRTSFRSPFTSLLPKVNFLPFGVDPKELSRFFDSNRGIAALIVEPIQGRAGVKIPPQGWLQAITQTAHHHGVLVIFDEILTGGSRTGPFFSCQENSIQPDLLCCGKAISGGYPIAATIGRKTLMDAWPNTGEAIHTATFLAHPVACAASLAALDLLTTPDLTAHRQTISRLLATTLNSLSEKSTDVLEVRGKGLLYGVELKTPGAAVTWTRRARNRGILTLPSGPLGQVIELLPAFTIDPDQLLDALHRLFPG